MVAQKLFKKWKAPGSSPGLNKKQKHALFEKLKVGARAAGFLNEQWRQKRVRQVIEQEFGVHYHRNYIGHLLKDLGWRVQKIEPRATERDEELIRAWLKRDWARIKRGGSAQRSCLKMNLACHSRNRSVFSTSQIYIEMTNC
jgi:transposase